MAGRLMDEPGRKDEGPGPASCPICGAAVLDPAYAPFCSARCRTIDLGRWLDEGYRVSRPIEQADLEQDD